jgi:hypothetical protein
LVPQLHGVAHEVTKQRCFAVGEAAVVGAAVGDDEEDLPGDGLFQAHRHDVAKAVAVGERDELRQHGAPEFFDVQALHLPALREGAAGEGVHFGNPAPVGSDSVGQADGVGLIQLHRAALVALAGKAPPGTADSQRLAHQAHRAGEKIGRGYLARQAAQREQALAEQLDGIERGAGSHGGPWPCRQPRA